MSGVVWPPPRGVMYWVGGWWTYLVRRQSGCAYCGSAFPHIRRYCDEALAIEDVPWEPHNEEVKADD